MHAIFYFVSLRSSLVKQCSAGQLGRNLIYCMPGLDGGAYKAMPRTAIPEPLGITLLVYALPSSNLHLTYGMIHI
ncbi:hypothetical protein WAI453_001994 [Rhynchosporium graminicola]